MTLRTVIVDDEAFAVKRLRRLLGEHQDVSVIGEACNAAEASRIAAGNDVDVLFVDIEMPGGSGVDLVRSLSPRPAVVFTTAHARYAVDAFDENAVDYLLKPVAPERLGRALHRVRRTLGRRDVERVSPVQSAPLHSACGQRIAVRNRSEVIFIDPLDIAWVAAEGNYCRIHASGQTYTVRQLIGEFAQRLGPPFVRVHRSALVSAEHIRKVIGSYDDGYTVVLADGTSIRVGSSYAHLVQGLVARAL